MTIKLIVALVYIAGCALTIANGVSAFVSSEQRLRRYAGRVEHSDRYAQEEKQGAADIDRHGRAGAKQKRRLPDHQPTAHELAQHLVDSFYQNRVKLVLAGVGLAASTAASVTSLFV